VKFKLFLLFLFCLIFKILLSEEDNINQVWAEGTKFENKKIISLVGKVKKIDDGDSFVLENNRRIRLIGIDSPELFQDCISKKDTKIIHCGKQATEKLKSLIKNNEVSCFSKKKDIYDRFLAECFVEIENKKININEEMIVS
jgi:endonuclease YncB( thermonuclease family)